MNRRGFTLIEIVVASIIVLGIFIVSTSFLLSGNRMQRQVGSRTTAQMDANFAMDHVSRNYTLATQVSMPIDGGPGSQLTFWVDRNPVPTQVFTDDIQITYDVNEGTLRYTELDVKSKALTVSNLIPNVNSFTVNRQGRTVTITLTVSAGGAQPLTLRSTLTSIVMR